MTSKQMEANLKENIKNELSKKRHRRTKAEMEAFRKQQATLLSAPIQHISDVPVKQKRHRRTKAEMEEARRQQALAEAQPKAKYMSVQADKTSSKPSKKRSVLKVGQSINIGDELMKFGGYVVNKADDRNFILSYKGLFQGYYPIDVNGLKAMMEKIGMGIIFKEPKVRDQDGLIDVNTILIALDKFEKFLRAEFLCRDGDAL